LPTTQKALVEYPDTNYLMKIVSLAIEKKR